MENFNLKSFLAEGKLLKEEQLSEIKDSDQALGVLFHSEEDEDGMIDYFYDVDAVTNLIQSMGYEDYEDVASEFTHYFSPGDEDEMRIFRAQESNPELQPTDLTIGMYKRNIEKEFEK
jgi:hypothetical protein